MDSTPVKFSDTKAVSPLRKLLMNCDIQHMFDFLHRIHVPVTVSCHFKSKNRMLFTCRIFIQRTASDGGIETLREYVASYSQNDTKGSAKLVVADALSKFLIGEQRDFHEFSAFLHKKGEKNGN